MWKNKSKILNKLFLRFVFREDQGEEKHMNARKLGYLLLNNP